MAKESPSLLDAMKAGDLLAEAERRYSIIAAVLEPTRVRRADVRPVTGTEIKALSIEADRLIHKIVALRAEAQAAAEVADGSADAAGHMGQVVELDVNRFRKSG